MIRSQSWFTCHYCDQEYPQEDQCDHMSTIHTWCWNCCHEFYEEFHHSSYLEDLD